MKTPAHRSRRSGVLLKVGLIVEGQTEAIALPLLHRKKLLPNCPPLKPVNLGGVGPELQPVGIARLVAPKVIALHFGGCQRIVVCFDREERDECAPGLAQAVAVALRAELSARGKAIPDVRVVVADRAFEAWLLAGAAGLHKSKHFQQKPAFATFEGQLGAQKRKGAVELTKLLGREYSKTKDGPALFEALPFAEARSHGPGKRGSRSLDKLLRTLGL